MSATEQGLKLKAVAKPAGHGTSFVARYAGGMAIYFPKNMVRAVFSVVPDDEATRFKTRDEAVTACVTNRVTRYTIDTVEA